METTTRHAREATRARQDVAAYIAIRVRATTTTMRDALDAHKGVNESNGMN